MAKMKKDHQLSLLLPISAREPEGADLKKSAAAEMRVGKPTTDQDAREMLVFELKKSGLLALKKG